MKGDAQPRCDLLEISYLCGRINNMHLMFRQLAQL